MTLFAGYQKYSAFKSFRHSKKSEFFWVEWNIQHQLMLSAQWSFQDLVPLTEKYKIKINGTSEYPVEIQYAR